MLWQVICDGDRNDWELLVYWDRCTHSLIACWSFPSPGNRAWRLIAIVGTRLIWYDFPCGPRHLNCDDDDDITIGLGTVYGFRGSSSTLAQVGSASKSLVHAAWITDFSLRCYAAIFPYGNHTSVFSFIATYNILGSLDIFLQTPALPKL